MLYGMTFPSVVTGIFARLILRGEIPSEGLFIGNVVKQLARKRIERRDAIALAYLSQLLLNSLL
jgi:hypothetical protein